MSDPTRAQQAQILENAANMWDSDLNSDEIAALKAGAAALRAPSPVEELEAVIDRFIAEMEWALPNLIQHYAHKLVRREMERAKGRTVRGLSAQSRV